MDDKTLVGNIYEIKSRDVSPLCLHALRPSPRLLSCGCETVCYDHNAADTVKGVALEIFHCLPVFFPPQFNAVSY